MRIVRSTVAGSWLLTVVSVALILVLPSAAQYQEPNPIQQTVRLKRGQHLVLQLLTSLNSGSAKVGNDVSLKVFLPLNSDGVTILPAGWRVRGRITKVIRADKNCKQGKIAWQLDQISTADGSKITISLDMTKETREKTGKAIAARKGIQSRQVHSSAAILAISFPAMGWNAQRRLLQWRVWCGGRAPGRRCSFCCGRARPTSASEPLKSTHSKVRRPLEYRPPPKAILNLA